MDLTVLNLAVPTLSAELQRSGSQLLWIIDIYGFFGRRCSRSATRSSSPLRPPERAGAASAWSETASELSGAVGVALFGSIGSVVYRHSLQESLPPSLPDLAAGASLATIGSTPAVVHRCPMRWAAR